MLNFSEINIRNSHNTWHYKLFAEKLVFSFTNFNKFTRVK